MQSLKNNPFLSAASMSSQNVDTFGRQEFYDTQPGYSQEMERRSNSQFSLNRIGSQRDLDIIERERETSAAIRVSCIHFFVKYFVFLNNYEVCVHCMNSYVCMFGAMNFM